MRLAPPFHCSYQMILHSTPISIAKIEDVIIINQFNQSYIKSNYYYLSNAIERANLPLHQWNRDISLDWCLAPTYVCFLFGAKHTLSSIHCLHNHFSEISGWVTSETPPYYSRFRCTGTVCQIKKLEKWQKKAEPSIETIGWLFYIILLLYILVQRAKSRGLFCRTGGNIGVARDE